MGEGLLAAGVPLESGRRLYAALRGSVNTLLVSKYPGRTAGYAGPKRPAQHKPFIHQPHLVAVQCASDRDDIWGQAGSCAAWDGLGMGHWHNLMSKSAQTEVRRSPTNRGYSCGLVLKHPRGVQRSRLAGKLSITAVVGVWNKVDNEREQAV